MRSRIGQKVFGGLLAAALLLPCAVYAAEIPAQIKGKDAQAICNILQGYGTAELSQSEKGEPTVTGRMNGVKYSLDFYGCTNKDGKVDANACTDVMFVAVWKMPGFTEKHANDWNNSRRFGTVSVKDDTTFLALPVNLNNDGVSRSNFEDSVEWWRAILQQFSKELDKISGQDDTDKPKK